MTELRRALGTIAAALVILTTVAADAQAPTPPKREITQIRGDLYRFQNDFHFSVFLVTPAGVIATDPINADAAKWLKEEVTRRFNQPIRYVIYSHDHADHIGGGEVFADSATIVAHANAKGHIIAEGRPTAVPHVTFADRMTITLGGKEVEIAHLGRNHSDNSIVMRFPAERVVFAVDFAPVKSLAWRDFPNGFIEELFVSLERLEAMDYDILAPGHGALGTKADVADHRKYLTELRSEVLSRVRKGMPLEQVKAEVTMPAYAEWGGYKDWLGLNVEGMYRHLSNYRRGN
ncbi:MAG: MBL fold metallo-hydrolase [Alphaproteobacteria bacterium]|nr:MBL fold metallo-hydrolase [Alphaproteobacteria bacterium]